MLRSLYIVFLLLISNISYTQIFHNECCGYSGINLHTKNNISLDNKIKSQLDSGEVLYRIPVKFWIYRSSKGKNGLSLVKMKEEIDNLNYYYSNNNTGIRFYLRPDYEYIDSDRLFKLRYISQAPFQTLRHRSKGCINVYVANKLKINKKFSIDKNFSGTYNSFSKGVIIAQGVSSSTLSHEIGHFLGLLHPHRLWKVKALQEPVSREKKGVLSKKKLCEKRGDKLCDTPAEPNLTLYTNKNCKYVDRNIKDKHGDKYKPSTNNIMSYTSNRECRNNFTQGQISVMYTRLSKSKYTKAWKSTNNEVDNFNFDTYEPDDNKNTASEIFSNSAQIHTFHKIYSGKKKDSMTDQSDWMYFIYREPNKKNIKLSFSETKFKKAEIMISIYRNSELIFDKLITHDNYHEMINLEKPKQGKYYINIKQTTTKEHITAIKILVVY